MAKRDWSIKVSEAPEGVRRQWRADRALRPPMASPGRPQPSRAVQREFWRVIATRVTTAEAAIAVGASVPVGMRWFRHAGGMPPISLAEPTGYFRPWDRLAVVVGDPYPPAVSVFEVGKHLRWVCSATVCTGGMA